jgi:hypothetical protein
LELIVTARKWIVDSHHQKTNGGQAAWSTRCVPVRACAPCRGVPPHSPTLPFFADGHSLVWHARTHAHKHTHMHTLTHTHTIILGVYTATIHTVHTTQMDTRSFGTVLGPGTEGIADLTERVKADTLLDW